MEKLSGLSFLILWLQLNGVTSQQKVEQSPLFLAVQEGANIIVNCTYTDTTFDYFYWYHQYSGKGPQLLIKMFSNGRFTIHLNKGAQLFSLHISASQSEDSGTHFCAASAWSSLCTCSPCINLQLRFQLLTRGHSHLFITFSLSANKNICSISLIR
uniref:Ig-like domain-containing protein n=1 Tax=Monodelphis domestica TaxID=13616 RepID=A0A5F8GBW3_MONDO